MFNGRSNLEMEPTLLTVRAIKSPRSAAHFARWADRTIAKDNDHNYERSQQFTARAWAR